MSWPHILSFSRIIAGPIVAALVLHGPGDAYLLAALVFGGASVTDLIDGKLARHGRRTNTLGVFLDTTSDKVLVSLALIAMAVGGLLWAWVPLVIVGREFIISGLRSYAASCNTVISAHIWGKGKAALTMAGIVAVLLAADGRVGGVLSHVGSHTAWNALFLASTWLLAVAAGLTVVSGARYLVDAWPLFRPGPRLAQVQDEEPPRMAAGGKR